MAIHIEHLNKYIGKQHVLRDICLTINDGEVVGLLGPNGAGKTTLIRIINRITIPNDGSVIFDGRPITQEDVEKIGYLPEERGLYRKMKVGEQAVYLAQLPLKLFLSVQLQAGGNHSRCQRSSLLAF